MIKNARQYQGEFLKRLKGQYLPLPRSEGFILGEFLA
jgi:hypothetical protein